MKHLTGDMAAVLAVLLALALTACKQQQDLSVLDEWTAVSSLATVAGTWQGSKTIEMYESLGGVTGTRTSTGPYEVTLTITAGVPAVALTERMDFDKFLDDFFGSTKDSAWQNVKDNIKPPSEVISDNYFLASTLPAAGVAEVFAKALPNANLMVNQTGEKLKVNVLDKLRIVQDGDIDMTLYKQ
jgi:hypothetical protein